MDEEPEDPTADANPAVDDAIDEIEESEESEEPEAPTVDDQMKKESETPAEAGAEEIDENLVQEP